MPTDTPTKEVGKEIRHIFSQYLTGNQPVVDYLLSRGVSQSLIDEERIGYCPPFLNYWFTLMKGRVVVSIEDAYGEIIAFAGRKYEPSADAAKESIRQMYGRADIVEAENKVAKWERGKWLNEPYPKIKHLFNLNYAKEEARKRGYIILVEGYFDALIMASNGFPNTVALCGASLSERQAVLIKRYCSNVVSLLDGDEAGEKGIDAMAPCLEKYDLHYNAIYLPEKYDPDEFVLKIGARKLRPIIENLISGENQRLRLNLNK